MWFTKEISTLFDVYDAADSTAPPTTTTTTTTTTSTKKENNIGSIYVIKVRRVEKKAKKIPSHSRKHV
jgi:hypothetical protein